MALNLNGWRRLGVVAVAIWLLGIMALAIFEHQQGSKGIFVERTLPIGLIIQGNQATLPDGRVVSLRQAHSSRDVKPWNIDWENEPNVPSISLVRWERLVGVGFAFPLMVWLALELLTIAARWVTRGFKRDAA